MTRTVTDAVAVFQVIVGEDPEDPMTARSRGRQIPDYRKSLDLQGLKGARLGILRQAYERPSADPDVIRVFTRALEDLRAAGAVVVDGVKIENPRTGQGGGGGCRGFKYDINEYLKTRGQKAPVHSLDEIIASPLFAQIPPVSQNRLKQSNQGTPNGPDSDACKADAANREAFGASVTRTMDAMTLDALIYPTWSNPPRRIDDSTSPTGDNSQVYSPRSGFPAINVPMGYSRYDTLPVGMTILGRAWDEARIIRIAFAYEQKTQHRRPPKF
jgi:Asp-tRNA(Asn)/Glu-tRNA(Gln) amidotransferase A subunit family amidase